MKLELKHVAPYFPYGLKVLHTTFVSFEKHIERVDIIESMSDCLSFKTCMDWYFNDEENDCEIKLLLRPLSDLTKEIEINGEKFVPSKEFEKLYLNDCKWGNNSIGFGIIGKSGFMTNLCFMNNEIIGECPLAIYELLIKWHFDIFGLINNGLAIDINSLNK